MFPSSVFSLSIDSVNYSHTQTRTDARPAASSSLDTAPWVCISYINSRSRSCLTYTIVSFVSITSFCHAVKSFECPVSSGTARCGDVCQG